MALLVKDRSESDFDSLQEDWANPEKIDEILQEISFEKGKLSVTIADELSKIQVNALVSFPESREFNPPQVMLWDRYLRLIGSEEQLKDDSDPWAITFARSQPIAVEFADNRLLLCVFYDLVFRRLQNLCEFVIGQGLKYRYFS